jgi:eukaryotic-like serine/threonine-protein kinase
MSAPQLPAGTVIANKYSVVALLGFGGSSATYAAVGADGREVALKVFDPAIRQRADIMAAIEQTYAGTNALPADVAVPLLDAGYDAATGAPFSVTERITFPSLAQIASQRPLSPDEVGTLLAYLARALDAAHARQLFHHALKPTNIFVGFGQGQGIRITDFGAGLPRAAVPTQEGYAIAAPWLAPEQITGGSAGAGSDVFATALVTFYALTGRNYWRSCQGAPDLNGWQRELQAPRTPPSARARELGAVLSTGFDGLLGASLAVDPAQRFRSVGELAAAVESLVVAKGPETAATMAFPSMALGGGGGDYPPPPPPLAGHGQPGPAAGAPAQQPQMPQQMAQPPQQQPQMPPQQQPGQGPPHPGYIPPPQQSSPSMEHQRRPTMEVGQIRRPASSKLAPVLVGLVALVLVIGGVAAWVVMGHKTTPETVIVPLASASAVVAAADSAAPTASAVEAPSAPSAEPVAPPPPAGEEVTLSCEPACDEIKVDDKAIELDKPLTLPEGKHTVVASKAEYKTVNDTITVVAGQKLEKQWKLASTAPKATGGGGTVPTQPVNKPKCSRFIKVNCQR